MTITSTLFVGRNEITNIFRLLGDNEDSISLAIAWAFSKSPALLGTFLKRRLGFTADNAEVQVRIHRYEAHGGITDIELAVPGTLHVIIEAKRG
jgi:hypothetical protein